VEDYGPEASPDEHEGGSSQDEYESDFINDDRVEYEGEEKKKIVKRNGKEGEKIEVPKLHSSEEEYYSKSQGTNSDDEEGGEKPDIYDTLPYAEDMKDGGFKYDSIDSIYYLPDGFCLPEEIYGNLFPHQRIGIQWLYNLYREEKGGVLGDDMGLGKTVQICAYLKGLFDADKIKKVIIVVPATMKSYWHGEL
jgi:DNA excision repair protein ERCC-6